MPRNLTDEDVAAITEALKAHTTCNLGLTSEEVSTLKRVLSAFDAAASTIGKTVLVALVGVLLAILTKGFWITLVTGIKKAGG